MFEDYLQDSSSFYDLAIKSIEERDARMYFRASIFCAASSMEAFVNFIADTIQKGRTIDKIEIAFINDKIIEVDVNKAKQKEKTKFNLIEDKIKFLIRKFDIQFDLSSNPAWKNYIDFKDLRNTLIHSRSMEDEVSIDLYKTRIRNGINAIIEIMNVIAQKFFGKALRKNLNILKIN